MSEKIHCYDNGGYFIAEHGNRAGGGDTEREALLALSRRLQEDGEENLRHAEAARKQAEALPLTLWEQIESADCGRAMGCKAPRSEWGVGADGEVLPCVVCLVKAARRER